MSEQNEEENLRRWSREQAELERQTDVMVMRTLTSLVTQAEDLKSKLRRDTECILENFRRSKRSLDNELALAAAQRQRRRREAEDERDAILDEARWTAAEIVQDAEREREAILTEVRSMEQRLRGLEAQVQDALRLGAAAATEPTAIGDAEPTTQAADATAEPVLVPTDELTDLLEGDVTASPAPARVALADGSDTIAMPQGIGHEPEPQATPEAPPPAGGAGAPSDQIVVVGGTGSIGARLRSEPGNAAQTIAIVTDFTPLVVIGPDRVVDGITWRNVRAPSGREGWISASFVTSGREAPPVGAPDARPRITVTAVP